MRIPVVSLVAAVVAFAGASTSSLADSGKAADPAATAKPGSDPAASGRAPKSTPGANAAKTASATDAPASGPSVCSYGKSRTAAPARAASPDHSHARSGKPSSDAAPDRPAADPRDQPEHPDVSLADGDASSRSGCKDRAAEEPQAAGPTDKAVGGVSSHGFTGARVDRVQKAASGARSASAKPPQAQSQAQAQAVAKPAPSAPALKGKAPVQAVAPPKAAAPAVAAKAAAAVPRNSRN